MSKKKTKQRLANKHFPKLVQPNGESVSAVEIDVDALSREKAYEFGGWDDLIHAIAAKWVKEHRYKGTGTIWQWGSPSSNFQHQSYSMFYAILGMPEAFREYLSA